MERHKKWTRRRTMLVASGISLSTVGLLSYFLKEKANRLKEIEIIEKGKRKFSRDKRNLPIIKAGHPDPNDLEDNNMVSEGSIYPVKYDNKEQQ